MEIIHGEYEDNYFTMNLINQTSKTFHNNAKTKKLKIWYIKTDLQWLQKPTSMAMMESAESDLKGYRIKYFIESKSKCCEIWFKLFGVSEINMKIEMIIIVIYTLYSQR